jgi:peptidoglycan/xylan/chitin deacetylase (PgdA/CDA1 family)
VISRAAKRRAEWLLVNITRARAPKGRRVVVLAYHSVHPTRGFASVTPDDFVRHLEWLKEHCDLVEFRSIPQLAHSDGSEKPIVAITFDDGYDDNYTYALPALSSMEIRATVFVTTGLVEGDPAVVRRLRALWNASGEDVKGLSWRQMEEMLSAGVTFGAHTVSHPNMAALDQLSATQEMRTSRDILEEHLQVPVETFAYPFGNPRYHFSRQTTQCAAQVGFKAAGSVQFRGVKPRDNALRIPRFPVTRDSIGLLRAKVYGGLDLIGEFRDRAPLWALKLTSAESPKRLDRAMAGFGTGLHR